MSEVQLPLSHDLHRTAVICTNTLHRASSCAPSCLQNRVSQTGPVCSVAVTALAINHDIPRTFANQASLQDTHFPDVETRESTTEIGLRLVGQLKRSQDKNGRNVAVHFLDLPSRIEYPDYFEQTPMPLSLNMIEQRLKNFEYPDLERLESDLKRMVQNAKDYNNSKSSIFEDAERIRKALSNFMPKHNPAYLRDDYRAYPTPIPQELYDQVRQQSMSSEGTGAPDKVRLVFSNPAARRRQSHATPSTVGTPAVDGREDFKQDFLGFLERLSEQEDAIVGSSPSLRGAHADIVSPVILKRRSRRRTTPTITK